MASTEPTQAAPKPRVLVADDDAATRELIAATLCAHNYDVEVAEDGQVAVELFANDKFDVVLADVVMPRVTGLEACRAIKGSHDGSSASGESEVPVVLMFTKTDTKSRIQALDVGADAYVCKPFEEAELVSVLDGLLRIKRLRDQVRVARQEVSRLRASDPLTGASSFVTLHERLQAEFTKAEAHAEPLACCLVDIDALRAQNERHGRAVGDSVLRGVSEVIVGSLRESDVVARLGGDEFFVMLPGTHFAGSLVVASRIWREVAARAFVPEGEAAGGRVTVSLGVALFPSRDVRTKDALLGALEAALREAKRRGGNRLCVFQQQGFIYTPAVEGS